MTDAKRLKTVLVLAVLALAACGAGASAALAQSSSANAVLQDCLAHPGGLHGSYTVAQLRHALQVMPAEDKEYTSCPDVINRALIGAVGTGRSKGVGGGGSSSFLPTPVIVILVLLVLAAVTLGAIALRRRRAAEAHDAEGAQDDRTQPLDRPDGDDS
jgi:hypothetical protein